MRPLFARGQLVSGLACDCSSNELCIDQFGHGVTLHADAGARCPPVSRSASQSWLATE